MAPKAARVAMAYLGGGDDRRTIVGARLGEVLAILRAQYVNYQHSHWQSQGSLFYADHLLFQRLYESVQGQVDELAEKIVGYIGTSGLNAVEQAGSIAQWVTRWSAISHNHSRGILSEEDLQRTLKGTYDELKAIGALPLGLDDWLMSTASAHESNMYLLQQSVASGMPNEA